MGISIMVAVVFYFVDKLTLKNIKKVKDKNVILTTWIAMLTALSAVVLIMTAARLSFLALGVGIVAALILVKKQKYLILVAVLLIAFSLYPSTLRNRMVSTFTVYFNRSAVTFQGNVDQQIRNKLNIPTLPKMKIREGEGTEQSPDITPGEPTDPSDIGVYRSLAIRLDVEWPRAIRSLTKNPLLGTGYSSIGLATDNDLLRSLGEVGILGTLAFILILVELIKRLVRLHKVQIDFFKYFTAGVLAMIVAFVINSLFIDVFEGSKIAAMFWILAGMALATGKFVKEKK